MSLDLRRSARRTREAWAAPGSPRPSQSGFTTTEKIAEIGLLKLEQETTKRVAMTPLLGGAAIVAGVVLVVVGARSRRDSVPAGSSGAAACGANV